MKPHELKMSGLKLKQTFKRSSDEEIGLFLENIMKQMTSDVLEAMDSTMREEFGFGEKRLERLRVGIQRRLR